MSLKSCDVSARFLCRTGPWLWVTACLRTVHAAEVCMAHDNTVAVCLGQAWLMSLL